MMNKNILLPDRPIAFNRDFVKLGIGVNGALFLSQAIYWSKRTKDRDGWFYKTNMEWEEETGLTKTEQLTVKKKLVEKGFIKVEKRGIPAKNYFLIDTDEITSCLISALQVDTNPDDQSSQTLTTSGKESVPLYTESTTEITTYTTTECVVAHSQKKKLGEFENVFLTDEEIFSLKERVFDYQQLIEELSQYLASSGKRYKSHYATILAWDRRKKQNTNRKTISLIG